VGYHSEFKTPEQIKELFRLHVEEKINREARSMARQLLFSLTANDFEFQTFCTGGAGGQHRNAKQNGVRCIHTASGARAEHRDGRDQRKNKEAAFKKCAETKEFIAWHKAEVARRLGNNTEDLSVNGFRLEDCLVEYIPRDQVTHVNG
jgi:protein subunit release factor B